MVLNALELFPVAGSPISWFGVGFLVLAAAAIKLGHTGFLAWVIALSGALLAIDAIATVLEYLYNAPSHLTDWLKPNQP